MQVKQGTCTVTVDLVNKTCDCRVFQLTGVPCQHAVSAIHSSRQQPIAFVSEYYKRDKYLQSYSYALEALKGEDFWEYLSNEPLLPPDIPKKLRGMLKRLRRREEWERGNRCRPSQITASQVGSALQTFSGRRIMHCSSCGQTGHRKNKCPNPRSEHLESTRKKGKIAEKEGQNGEGEKNKSKRTYKPKRKANVSWRNKMYDSKAGTENEADEARCNEADDEQED